MADRQNNTRSGILPITVATTTLVDKEGYLAKLSSTGITPITAASDMGLYLVIKGAAVGAAAEVQALSPERNVRIRLNGTCSKGDVLVLATGGDAGKVAAYSNQTGVLFSPGIAEEDGVDEQYVLVRPLPRYLVGETAATAFTVAAPATTAATNSTPYGYSQAQADAIKTNVIEMRAALIAKGIMAAN
jgi:hypothetical protein